MHQPSPLRFARPLLLYDGDCAFCAYWARYWQRLTADQVDYRSYQETVHLIPDLDAEQCRRAVQLIAPDGQRWAGAAASFRILRYGGCGAYMAAYERSPWFARLTERAYGAIARRREAAYALARGLWGNERHPARYRVASSMFVRVIALIHVVAFVSLATQIRGLVGADGILPAGDLLEAAAQAWPGRAWLEMPSLFWLAHTDGMLLAACGLGAVAGAVAALGVLVAPLLLLCYVLYLSLFVVGQDFLAFQWDLLLLEAGFLAAWLPLRSALVPALYRLLLFRFMFLSGCVKLLSGDPTWAALTALDFHYETQPLPTPLAWYAHQLPSGFDRLCAMAMFVTELALPFLIFTPRRPRMLAAGGFILLQIGILLTGNYNFFNLLCVALCLFLFDDAQFRSRPIPPLRARRPITALALCGLGAIVIAHNAYYLARPFAGTAMPGFATTLLEPFAPFRIVNSYGLFAVMTTTRPEIEIQGSIDGHHWLTYEFRYKPGDAAGPLRWNIPHQPRLDWQMWFAALSDAGHTPWFGNLLIRLLENSPPVVALLRYNPFPDEPPRYVRALTDEYRFTHGAERKRSGRVWERRPLGLYYPPVRLP